jgi:hypothetical protein
MSKKISAIAIKRFAMLVVLGMVYQAMAQDAMTPYLKMAPVDQYLMADRAAEIALARAVQHRSPFHTTQRCRFLDDMVSKQRSKARTASCVSWDARGHPLRMLTFGIRKCGFPCVLTRQPHVVVLGKAKTAVAGEEELLFVWDAAAAAAIRLPSCHRRLVSSRSISLTRLSDCPTAFRQTLGEFWVRSFPPRIAAI